MDTTTHVELVADLRRLLRVRFLDPLEILLADQADAVEPVRSRLEANAEAWAAQLLDGDDATATATVVRIVAALYPGDTAFDPPHAWWGTPLGRAVASRSGHPSVESVPQATAAAMLRISRQGVADLLARGKLERHSSGGVTSASIRHRLRGTHARRSHH